MVLAVCLSFTGAFSDRASDALIGKWLIPDEGAIFDFYREKDEFRARLIPLRNPELKDTNNTVDSLNGRTLNGATLIYGLKYDEKKQQWLDGWVYNPEDGRTYHCCCTLKANGARLVFRGYLGVSLLGQSQTWKKVSPVDTTR
jgi:uncharacterized protein (DUF2147 family)